MQQLNIKHNNSIATGMHATTEELWEAVFSVGPCRGFVLRIETQASQSREVYRVKSLQLAVQLGNESIGDWHRQGTPIVVICCVAILSLIVRWMPASKDRRPGTWKLRDL
jgi:hypothetical protein